MRFRQTRQWIAGSAALCLPLFEASGATNLYVRGSCTNPVPPYASWATAATSVVDAVNVAVDGDTVWVTNGEYHLTSQLSITNGVTLRSVQGSAGTTITQDGSNLLSRVLSIDNPNAAVAGFTLSGGASLTAGGGVFLSAGLLSNCTVQGNTSTLLGGGVYCDASGRVVNCEMLGNIGVSGGGLYVRGLADHCTVRGNYAAGMGGGVVCADGGILRNSTVTGNGIFPGLPTTPQGGGVYGQVTGLVENCTIAGNSVSLDGGGLFCLGSNGVVRNSVIYDNSADRNDPNYSSSGGGWSIGWSCVDPLQPGPGNTADDPEFRDPDGILNLDYSLLPGSPCINTGTNQPWMAGALDMADHTRIMATNVDMGAFEFDPLPFDCNFRATPRVGGSPLQVVFKAILSGTNTSVKSSGPPRPVTWRFKRTHAVLPMEIDGWSQLLTLTNTFAVVDTYKVTLEVVNTSSNTASVSKAAYIRVGAGSAYVSPSGNDANNFPYTNWATAAATVQAAVDAVADGGKVYVSNGVYEVSSQIRIENPVTVQSVRGAEETTIAGLGGTRCFWMDHTGAVVQGFTVQGGQSDYGAGLYAQAGTVRNCIVRDNTATTGGGGLQCGPQVTVVNCLFFGNSSLLYGGGVWNEGSLVNCTVASNASVVGGGVYNTGSAPSLTNTILYGNNAATGAQYSGTASFAYCCASPVAAGVSNFDANPLFVFPAAGVYRIASNSPCRDAGTNLSWMTNSVDLAGFTRQYTNGIVDVGAYEWGSTAPLLLIYYSDPSTGEIRYKYGSNVTCSVQAAVVDGDTRYSNTGWSVTGNVTSNGVGTNVTITQTGDSVLSWLWSTQYFFSAVSADLTQGGVTGDTNGWYDAGDVLYVTAVPSNYYHLVYWLGYGGDAVNLVLTNTQPRDLTAVFAQNLTTNGTPELWLASYGLTNPTLAAADVADFDLDGAPAWAEYVAGTDPTNLASCFALRSIALVGSNMVIRWSSASNKDYRVYASTNAMDYNILVGPVTGFAASPPTNSCTNAVSAPLLLYRVTVSPNP